ncbi:MAG: DUF3305 domain-containing protein [Polaromonas sp.]|nr:DUF3305 domain-containing protein [Polaromonas sp.]
MLSSRPAITVAVTMRKERLSGAAARWQDWRWVLHDVAEQQPGFGSVPRLLVQNDREERWLHPGFAVELFPGDAEGYYLNVTTERPCFWVVWRMEEEASLAELPIAVPQIVTLSYHDAGRWLDAQESVDQVPAPDEVIGWLRAFVDEHHVPEVRRRQRPQSFKTLQDRFGNPARVSTGKNAGRAAGDVTVKGPANDAPGTAKEDGHG